MSSRGYTIIELMIVVACIAIFAAIAALKFGELVKKARDARRLGDMATLLAALGL